MKSLLDREDSIFDPPRSGCVLSLTGLPGGDGKIYDRSPYGNIGTIIGATWVMLPTGLWCLSFDGTDDVVDCGNGASLDISSGIITFEGWVKLDNLSQNSQVFNNGVPTGAGQWAIGPYGDFDELWVGIAGVGNSIGLSNMSTHLTAGKWHHWRAGYDITNTTFELYLDGVEQTLSLVTSYFGNAGTLNRLSLGATIDAGPAYGSDVAGDMALVRVYNRALSALEIQNHFNQERHLFGVWCP